MVRWLLDIGPPLSLPFFLHEQPPCFGVYGSLKVDSDQIDFL